MYLKYEGMCYIRKYIVHSIGMTNTYILFLLYYTSKVLFKHTYRSCRKVEKLYQNEFAIIWHFKNWWTIAHWLFQLLPNENALINFLTFLKREQESGLSLGKSRLTSLDGLMQIDISDEDTSSKGQEKASNWIWFQRANRNSRPICFHQYFATPTIHIS
jgi:hypothetical protein